MKRIFTALGLFTILFTLAGCQKDNGLIVATISHYHNGEKVFMDGNFAYWNDATDQIWINNGTGVQTCALQSLDANHFEIVMSEQQAEGTVLNALYPASVISQGATLSEGQISVTLPAEQVYTVDAQGRQVINAPMVAQATVNANHGADVTFHNVCSLLKVMVHANVFVHTITVSQATDATSHPSLAGAGTITFDDDEPTLEMATGGSQTITLTVNESRADGIYYIVIPPYEDETKLIVTVFDDPQTIIERGQAGNHTLEPGVIAVVNCIDNLRGIFSVSATDKVSFARGNLKGDGNDTPYYFTTEQYDAGDLYPQTNINTLSAAMGSNWFILSNDQWNYLLNVRPNHDNLKVRATIPNGGLRGIILLPDNWDELNCPVTVVDHNNFQGVEIQNWDIVETYGAVFIPAEGMNGNYYWSTTTGRAVDFGNGNGQGGNGNVCSHTGSAYIRHAHYVVQGGSTTTED